MSETKVEYSNDLDICVDCLMLVANGGVDSVEPSWCPDEHRDRSPYAADYCGGTCETAAENHVAAVERLHPEPWHLEVGSRDCEWCGVDVHGYRAELEDCEPWFSWSPCHGCGSGLGGSRMHGLAWRTVPA